MISLPIRFLLILGSLLTMLFMLRRIRKAQIQIEDSIFWLLFCSAMLIISIWPGLIYWVSYALGFQSPMSMVYLLIIFVLLIKQFFLTLRVSQLDSKLRTLVQRIALDETDRTNDNDSTKPSQKGL